MASMTTVLKALITADASQMQAQLKAAEGSLTAFSNKASAAGKKLSKNVTLPLVAVGGISIKAAADFEASMTKIESLVGLSSEAVQGFTEDVRSYQAQQRKHLKTSLTLCSLLHQPVYEEQPQLKLLKQQRKQPQLV